MTFVNHYCLFSLWHLSFITASHNDIYHSLLLLLIMIFVIHYCFSWHLSLVTASHYDICHSLLLLLIPYPVGCHDGSISKRRKHQKWESDTALTPSKQVQKSSQLTPSVQVQKYCPFFAVVIDFLCLALLNLHSTVSWRMTLENCHSVLHLCTYVYMLYVCVCVI